MNKTVLITGAAGGLGGAMVACFAAGGWKVIATDLMAPETPAGVDAGKVSPVAMDVTSNDAVAGVVARLKGAGVILDLVVNNAGIDRYFPLSEAPVERFAAIFDVNVFGAYRVNQQLLPLLRQPGGRIILIGSESLNLTLPFMAYPLSKRLLEGYAKALRQELHYRGIDVVVVRPGAIETPLLDVVRGLKSSGEPWRLSPQLHAFAVGAAKEIGRCVKPEEVASLVVRIAGKTSTRMVYRINNSLQLRLAALLPFRMMATIVRKRLG